MNTSKEKTYPRVLTIAGSDSGGGAGIQADIKSISANGCYALSVITALTAQNTRGVLAIHPVPVDFVRQQLDAVLDDIGADVVKIGMLFSPELIEVVAERLVAYGVKQIVLDPVMVATSGDPLLAQEAIDTLREKLIPLATLLTPNLPEAEMLLARRLKGLEERKAAAEELCHFGCANVLVKGGHLQDDASDLLWLGEEQRIVVLSSPRIDSKNTHGTGCTLSSAIAAGLARGLSLEDAVRSGKSYITEAIQSGSAYKLGRGNGPVDHFFLLKEARVSPK